ncbi:MAG: PQQ-binding-like beta-propeller repeat protein [Bacteroidales bacterium]
MKPLPLSGSSLAALCALTLMWLFSGCSVPSSKNGSEAAGQKNSWPIFRGDPSLQGRTSATLPQEPTLLWSVKTNSRTVASPVVANNRIYWCDRRGFIKGVDSEGEACFSLNLDTAVEASLLLNDSIAYVGTIDGRMIAVSLQTGQIKWSYATEGQISGSANLTRQGDVSILLFGSYDYFFYCLNAETGALIRKFESGYYLNGAAAVSGSLIAFGGCDAFVRVVDIETGLEIGSTELEVYIPSSPVFDENRLFVGDYNGTIYRIAVNDTTRTKLFSPATDNGSYVALPAIDGNHLIFTSDDNKIYCIDKGNGKVVWSYLLGDACESSPVVADDKVLICTKNGKVFILDAKTGAKQWSWDAGEMITASPAVVDDRFYLLTSKGTLFCFGNASALKP